MVESAPAAVNTYLALLLTGAECSVFPFRCAEHFADLERQRLGRERFLQKCNLALEHAVANDAVVGVARHAECTHLGARRQPD